MSDPRYDPRYQRGHEGEAVAPSTPFPRVVETVDAPRRRNPWLAVLWVLAVLLLALGIGPTLYYALTTSGSYEIVVTGEQYLRQTMLLESLHRSSRHGW